MTCNARFNSCSRSVRPDHPYYTTAAYPHKSFVRRRTLRLVKRDDESAKIVVIEGIVAQRVGHALLETFQQLFGQESRALGKRVVVAAAGPVVAQADSRRRASFWPASGRRRTAAAPPRFPPGSSWPCRRGCCRRRRGSRRPRPTPGPSPSGSCSASGNRRPTSVGPARSCVELGGSSVISKSIRGRLR